MRERFERFDKYMKYKGLNDNQVTAQCGLSQGLLNQARKGKSDLGNKSIDKILIKYQDLNRVWLLTGDGEMLIKSEAIKVPKEQVHIRIPLVGQYAYAGYLGGFADQEYLEMLPTIDFMPDREMTGNYVAFEVKGDSMDDGSKESYEQGEILVCREVEPYNWQYSPLHINKRDFVIVHTEGILVKRIINHDVTNHTITIHSLNPEYKDRIIDLADVRQIFSIIESRKQRRR
jgi:phage repressor protein C with HTH and peptisase S24 domain